MKRYSSSAYLTKPITKVSRARLLIRSGLPIGKNRAALVLQSPHSRCFESGLAGGERGADACTRPDWKQARCQSLSVLSRAIGEWRKIRL